MWFLIFLTLETPPPDTVRYGAERIIYLLKEERVILINKAWVSYKELRIDSDSIEYNTKTHILKAFGGVVFTSSTEKVEGEELYYSLDTKKGVMKRGKTQVEKGIFEGEEIWLVKEKTLNINKGYYTTCDHNPPHYYFYAPRMKAYLGNTAICEPVILVVRGIPILAAPFWFVPISSHRKSGLLPFKVGNSKEEGKYAKGISYYWVINDYSDMTFALDIMEKKGFKPQIEGVYIVNPYARGNFLVSYIQETDTKRRRYSINANHSSIFLYNSSLDAHADFQSDARYIADYAENPVQWLKKEAFSNIEIKKNLGLASLSLLFEDRRDFDKNTSQQKIPQLSLNLFSREIAKNLYWSLTTNFENLRTEEESLQIQRKGNFYTGLSFNRMVFGGINLSSGISYNHTIQEKDSLGRATFPHQALYTLSLSTGFSLYRIFGISGFGLQGLLHKITPNIGYSFTPKVRDKGWYSIPEFSAKVNSFSFSISNLLQGKFGKEKRDIALFNISTGYNIIDRERPISPLSSSAELYFSPLFNSRLSLSYNIYDRTYFYSFDNRWDIGSLLHSVSDTGKVKKYSLTFHHHYTKDGKHTVEPSLYFEPPGWKLGFTGNYDIEERRFLNYSLNITKDLHCWEALFSLNRLGDRWEYDFKIRIKAIPEVQFGRGVFGFLLPGIGR